MFKYEIMMKKNIIRAALFADLAMANVEALAGGGEVIVGPWYCAGSGYCYDVETYMGFDGTKYYF